MTTLIKKSLKGFTLVACVAVMFSCGKDDKNCQTCTMEGQESEEICEEGGIGSGTVFDAAILAQEALGYDCN